MVAVTNLSAAQDSTTGNIILTWDDFALTAGDTIQYYITDDGIDAAHTHTILEADDLTLTIPKVDITNNGIILPNDVSFYHLSNNGDNSNVYVLNVEASNFNAPADFEAVRDGGDIDFSWSGVVKTGGSNSRTGYEVFVIIPDVNGIDPDEHKRILSVDIQTPSYIFPINDLLTIGLDISTSYKYYVITTDDNGNSDKSQFVDLILAEDAFIGDDAVFTVVPDYATGEYVVTVTQPPTIALGEDINDLRYRYYVLKEDTSFLFKTGVTGDNEYKFEFKSLVEGESFEDGVEYDFSLDCGYDTVLGFDYYIQSLSIPITHQSFKIPTNLAIVQNGSKFKISWDNEKISDEIQYTYGLSINDIYGEHTQSPVVLSYDTLKSYGGQLKKIKVLAIGNTDVYKSAYTPETKYILQYIEEPGFVNITTEEDTEPKIEEIEEPEGEGEPQREPEGELEGEPQREPEGEQQREPKKNWSVLWLLILLIVLSIIAYYNIKSKS
jgi:hypothetical protein